MPARASIRHWRDRMYVARWRAASAPPSRSSPFATRHPRISKRTSRMNIHEYQGKAVLKEFGVPVSAGFPALTVDEAVEAAAQAARAALCGEEPDPCRRPRQGQVQGTAGRRQGRRAPGQVDRRGREPRQGDARQHAGDGADRPGRQAGQPPLHRGRLGHREGILPLAAGRPRDLARRLRRLDRRRHGHRGGRP